MNRTNKDRVETADKAIRAANESRGEHHTGQLYEEDVIDLVIRMSRENYKWVLTPGVRALGPTALARILDQTFRFNQFTPDNDPYGEHDFGSFDYEGQKVFWKIDYYNHDMTAGSEDPSDPEQTTRVLTIMLAEEY